MRGCYCRDRLIPADKQPDHRDGYLRYRLLRFAVGNLLRVGHLVRRYLALHAASMRWRDRCD